jgi:hypothetical protein
VVQLLCNDREKEHSLLGNGSVNTFPRKRGAHDNTVIMETGVFSVGSAPWNYLSIYLWLCSLCGLWPLFQFLNLYTVGRAPWTGYEPVARPLPERDNTNTE